MLNIFSANYFKLKFIQKILQPVLAPAFCESCYRTVSHGQIFCFDCVKLIMPVVNIDLKINAKYTVPVLAISNYADPLRKLILAKNGGNRLASKQLAQLIWEQTSFRYLAVDYVIPVPLHWTRLMIRGFNQAEIIAENLVEYKQLFNLERLASLENLTPNVYSLAQEFILNKNMIKNSGRDVANKSVQKANLLKRCKRTKYQAELKTVARWQNVQTAFSLNTELLSNKNNSTSAHKSNFLDSNNFGASSHKNIYANKNLVLVDDLMTTGATVMIAAKLLATLKPKSITVVVACRVV